MQIKCPSCGCGLHVSVMALNDKATIDQITRVVSERSGVPVSEILKKTRKADIIKLRHLAMWLSRQLGGATLTQIGKYFGKDHTSVIHAINAVNNHYSTYIEEQIELEALKSLCRAV